MPTFKITRTYKYTSEIEIEADNKYDAIANADDEAEQLNYDDTLYEQTIKQIAD